MYHDVLKEKIRAKEEKIKHMDLNILVGKIHWGCFPTCLSILYSWAFGNIMEIVFILLSKFHIKYNRYISSKTQNRKILIISLDWMVYDTITEFHYRSPEIPKMCCS